MRTRAWVMIAAAALSGCFATPLSPDSAKVSAPAGVGLPAAVPVMMHLPPQELDRTLVIEATRYRNQDTDYRDGRELEKAAGAVLRQVFRTVETNRPGMDTQVVVRPMGKAAFSRVDNRLKIGCGLDLFLMDGRRIGSFVARHDFEDPVDFTDAIPPGYAACLKIAADDMVRSPPFAQIAGGKAPAANPAAREQFLRSMGF